MSIMTDVLAKQKQVKPVVPYIKQDVRPFLLPRPGVVAFSGGRTSGLMLWSILQEYGGTLPDDIKVAFCNTGRERPETLDFIQACSDHWSVPIIWLEWTAEAPRYRVVDYATADRKGKVFRAMALHTVNRKDGTQGRKPLPNPVSRSCSAEMKSRTQRRWLDHTLGWRTVHKAIGFRADEPHRAARAPSSAVRGEVIHAPLLDAGLNEADVLDFWRKQPFDLQLKSHEGNCDLCFMKSRRKLNAIMRDRPDLAYWWWDMERDAMASDRPSPFRIDRPDYAQMWLEVQAEIAKDYGDFDDDTQCALNGCTD